jgi:hypothetical protein
MYTLASIGIAFGAQVAGRTGRRALPSFVQLWWLSLAQFAAPVPVIYSFKTETVDSLNGGASRRPVLPRSNNTIGVRCVGVHFSIHRQRFATEVCLEFSFASLLMTLARGRSLLLGPSGTMLIYHLDFSAHYCLNTHIVAIGCLTLSIVEIQYSWYCMIRENCRPADRIATSNGDPETSGDSRRLSSENPRQLNTFH